MGTSQFEISRRSALGWAGAAAVALGTGLPLFGFSPPAAVAATPSSPRKSSTRQMEYLTRGLVAAQAASGVFLSWRFLGNEPDGISWNVYRKDAVAGFVKITTIAPRDVQAESGYAANPGIVKKDVTPSNYTDPKGVLASVYEVAPVVDGVEGERQGMSVPMLSTLPGQTGQASRGAVAYIQLKPAPAPVPLVHFTYRNYGFGPGTDLSAADMVVPGTSGENWYVVDMNLLKGFRVAYEDQTTVTQGQLDGWVAKLNEYNMTRNAVGVATYAAARPLTNSLVKGKITKALYKSWKASSSSM